MSLFIRTFLFVFLCCISFGSDAQISTLRKKTLSGKIGTYQLDSLSIYPNSFFIRCGNEPLGSEGFKLDHASGKITILKACADSLTVSYRVLPMNLGKSYFKRDTTLLYSQDKGERDQFLVTNNYSIADAFGGSSLTKKGSISRGVTFGNNQDFGVNYYIRYL